jgi:bifunctional DNase/RNase
MKKYYPTTQMPRKAAHNVLYLNSKKIKVFPIVDTKNQSIKNEVAVPLLRCFRYYPLGFDFIVNIIQMIKDKGIDEYIIDEIEDDYFILTLTSEDINEYLKRFADHDARRSAKRQLSQQLHPDFIFSETKKEAKCLDRLIYTNKDWTKKGKRGYAR